MQDDNSHAAPIILSVPSTYKDYINGMLLCRHSLHTIDVDMWQSKDNFAINGSIPINQNPLFIRLVMSCSSEVIVDLSLP
jgi:hypothetical protein